MKSKSNASLCVVTIGYQHFVMPFDQGTRLMMCLDGAAAVDSRWSDEECKRVYVLADMPEVSLERLKPELLRQPPDTTNPDAAPRVLLLPAPKGTKR